MFLTLLILYSLQIFFEKIFAEKYFCSSAVASTIPSCPENFGLNNNILYNVSQESYTSRSSNELKTSRQGN